ncbi:hypothetical protein DICPUDRAFT_152760 [Dictyostelium purpureum]|uniref:Cysteine dioxygenase n=1 Tax=Dictyostelium purpureum TaxID=5786 RepID=F0ZM76_DICPU|nr:uncharacterized protein DICPUDRAFT_152760 [Dictyostelium purpureum]EGC34946.1 hypothetical protein DICPUDRAFT_152760 [Dictyostelium purpureum]|eukprot:XP_003288527.1 hypothetical protein DICPUDRAFT_152760 [Dictyostelium purpureum]
MNILNQLTLKANSLLSPHGIIPSDRKSLDALVSIFEKIKCSDLFIDKNQPLTTHYAQLGDKFKSKIIFYYPLLENEKFTLAIFAFPPHTKIPIHDHPQMTVLSKVLYGKVNCKSFDWIRKSNNEIITNNIKNGKARYIGERDITENDNVKITLPDEENIHTFETSEDHSAVLDLLYPPYEQYKRDCTYYRPTSPTLDFKNNEIIDFESYSPDFDCRSFLNHRGLMEIHRELTLFDNNHK